MSWNFTGLETLLISATSVFVGAVGMLLSACNRYVTKKECQLKHENEDNIYKSLKNDFTTFKEELKESQREVKKNQEGQSKMLRAIILYLDIPDEKKQEILNS